MIRIRIDTPLAKKSISINEIECTGAAIDSDARGYGNVFGKYAFEPTDQAAANDVWLPYSALTDGIESVWGDGRFATKNNGRADGTLDFGGNVYALHTLKIKYTGNVSNGLCGKEYKTSVVEYAKTILADSSYEANYPGINGLVKSMLNYGAYAQLYFGYKTDKVENLANHGIYTDANNPVLNGDFSGASVEKPIKTGVD